jgi:hypothetical protein
LSRVRKIAKTTISFVTSFRPSVCPHGTTRIPQDGFLWRLIFVLFFFFFFSKSFSKIKFSLKSDKNSKYPTFSEMFQVNFEEKIRTHVLCSLTFFFCRKSCVCEMISKKTRRLLEVTNDIMRRRAKRGHARAHTRQPCNTYCFSTAKIILESASVLLCLSCLFLTRDSILLLYFV